MLWSCLKLLLFIGVQDPAKVSLSLRANVGTRCATSMSSHWLLAPSVMRAQRLLQTMASHMDARIALKQRSLM